VDTVADLLDPVIGTVTEVVDPVTDLLDPLIGAVTDIIDPVLDPIVDILADVLAPVTNITSPLTNGLLGPILGEGGLLGGLFGSTALGSLIAGTAPVADAPQETADLTTDYLPDAELDTLLGGLLGNVPDLDAPDAGGADLTNIEQLFDDTDPLGSAYDTLLSDLLGDADVFGLDGATDGEPVLDASVDDLFAGLTGVDALTGSLTDTGGAPDTGLDLDTDIDSLLNDLLGESGETIYGTAAEFEALLGGDDGLGIGDASDLLGAATDDGLLGDTAIEDALNTLFDAPVETAETLLSGLPNLFGHDDT
jgi:hypothetical protein